MVNFWSYLEKLDYFLFQYLVDSNFPHPSKNMLPSSILQATLVLVELVRAYSCLPKSCKIHVENRWPDLKFQTMAEVYSFFLFPQEAQIIFLLLFERESKKIFVLFFILFASFLKVFFPLKVTLLGSFLTISHPILAIIPLEETQQ